MKDVNFEVAEVKNGKVEGYKIISVKFEGSEKTYDFCRRIYDYSVIISGCKVNFNHDYSVKNIERLYDTKGVKRADTSSMSHKIKKAILDNDIEIKEIKTEVPTVQIKSGEVHHEKYDQIKMCLEANIPVYLAGPAGSGKNFTVEQIAKELGWDFYFSNSVQQEYKLTGFIDAGGKFHDTEFYKACTSENDCIFFLDEMDASIPEVLVLLNAAIANKYFEFPTGRVNLNKVHFVSAGNTVGSGADEMYTGRMVLDQATLDRFAIIEFDYSLNIEMSIAKGNTELINFIHQLRTEAIKKGIRATFSYRCITMITKLEKAGMDLNIAIKISIMKGLDKDTINTFNPEGNSKYHKALNEIKMVA